MNRHESSGGPPVEEIAVSAYTVPTDHPEADGTFSWNSTTLVLAEARAGNAAGLGYTYADTATAHLIKELLANIAEGEDSFAIPRTWKAMNRAVRNLGASGIASMAIAAVDTALWDLKSRLLKLPLVDLLGSARESVPVYGSGGFTSYTRELLCRQLGDWAAAGISRVKMKVGAHPAEDFERVREARSAIGAKTELFVDANGAYSRKQALHQAERFAELGVTWFEEPVPSADLEGLRLIRDRAPAPMEIAAGEYGYELRDFKQLLDAGAVDVLQADATRCAGFTGFLQAAALCSAAGLELSAHCAPAIHAHVCCGALPLRHVEYFHDHERIENLLFDGVLRPVKGELFPDRSRPGMGLELKQADAKKYEVP